MTGLQDRIEREAKMLETWQRIIKRKGFNAVNALLVANQIYLNLFVGETKTGKSFYNIDAAELFAPVLEALPWQFIKDRYYNQVEKQPTQAADSDQEMVACPRCKKPLNKVEIAYPPDDYDYQKTVSKLNAWYCPACGLVIEDSRLDDIQTEQVPY